MSQKLSTEQELNGGHAAVAEQKAVQVALRLRAVDRSDRAIVSNVSAVHASSGMVFVDFGFVEQQAIDEVTRAMRAGAEPATNIDGRLECRIAMSVADIAQLERQLAQVLNAVGRQASTQQAGVDADLSSSTPTSLQ